MKPANNHHHLGIYFLLISVVLVWGLSWPVTKEGLAFIPPYWFAAIRQIIGNLAMFGVAICSKNFILPTKKDMPLIVSLGLFQVALFMLFISLGLAIQPSNMAVILVYTTPIWVMPMAIFIFKERSTLMKWVGVALGLSGVLIMLNPWVLDWTIKNTQIGILFLMLASLSMSISILCAKYMTWHHTPLQMIPWQLLVGSILLTMTATIMDPHPALHWNLTSSFSIAYTAIASTAFGFYGMTKLSKELPATVTSIGLLGVPVSGVFFSVIFLHERFNESMLLAMIFIITGVFTVIWGERKAG